MQRTNTAHHSECLVEIDCGGSLAGISTVPELLEIARAIAEFVNP